MRRLYHDMHKWFLSRYHDLLVSDALRNFALGMITLFIPIFLFQKGFTLVEIFAFQAFVFSLSFIFFWITDIYLHHLKTVFMLNYIFIILFYILFYQFDYFTSIMHAYLFLFVAGTIRQIGSAFYWLTHHLYFIKSTKKKSKGEKLGLLMAIPISLSIFAPLAGGYVISKFGFTAGFLVVILVLLLSSLAMIPSKDIVLKTRINVKKVFDYREDLIYFFWGIGGIGAIIAWPLLLFQLSNVFSVGFVYFVTGLIHAVILYFSGKMTDNGSAKKLVIAGSFLFGLSLMARAFSTTVNEAILIQTFGAIGAALFVIPIDATFYKKAQRQSSSLVLNREFYLTLGRVVGCFIAIYYVLFVPQPLITMIVTSGFSVLWLSLFFKQ